MEGPRTGQVDINDLPPLKDRRRDELLPLNEVAAYLGMKPENLTKAFRPARGRRPIELPYVTVGDGPRPRRRVYAADLVDYLAGKRQTASRRSGNAAATT